ncbi:MAG: hypothetical protein H6557_33570 [Lewinellaceae bacterium]|nr:hypothetical protein [Lewinellaceae bacterium]
MKKWRGWAAGETGKPQNRGNGNEKVAGLGGWGLAAKPQNREIGNEKVAGLGGWGEPENRRTVKPQNRKL